MRDTVDQMKKIVKVKGPWILSLIRNIKAKRKNQGER
jgi:hypothetical protein